MLDIKKLLKLQLLFCITESELICAGEIKAYPSSWLANTNFVLRDAYGRFAEKGDEVLKTAIEKKASLDSAIAEIRNDPQGFKRKVSSRLLVLTNDKLEKLVEVNPKLANQLTKRMFGRTAQETRDTLADWYEEINPGLPNAIKPDPFKEFVTDWQRQDKKELLKDIGRGINLAGYNYNKLIDELNNVQNESEAVQILGKVTAASIPIATYLAATLAPEVAIGLLLNDTLGTILTSFVVTQSASFAANKVLDEAEIENPVVRIGTDLAVAIAANPTTQVLKLSRKGIKGFTESKLPEEAKQAGKAYVNVAKGKVAQALRVEPEGISSSILSLILDTPIQRILFLKNSYRKGFKESARQAKEMAKNFAAKVPDDLSITKNGVTYEARHITFVSGGFAGRDGIAGVGWAKQLRKEDDLFNDHHIVKFINDKFDIPRAFSNKIKNPDIAINGVPLINILNAVQFKTMLNPVLKEGRNPAAVEMAAQAYAYAQKHPGVPVEIITHSAGGMIGHEAATILKELDIEAKVVNAGSPYWGLTPKNPNAITITSNFDPEMDGLPIQNPINIDSVTNHFNYFKDPNVRRTIKDFLDGKSVRSVEKPVETITKEASKDVEMAEVTQEILDKANEILANKEKMISIVERKINAAKVALENATDSDRAVLLDQLKRLEQALPGYQELDEETAIQMAINLIRKGN